MTDFIIKHLEKKHAGKDEAASRASYGFAAGAVGIVCNLLLFVCKLIAGLFASSVSVIADAVNNLSDASSSIISLVGFKLSQRPADREHPYGHGRYEYLAGLIVAVMIVVIGIEILKESVSKILHPETVNFTALSIIILIASVAVKLWLMLFYKRMGGIINSKTLFAAASDSMSDVVSTLAVLIGAAASKFLDVQLDGWIGVAVSVFVIISGFKTVKETLDPILGRAPDRETVEGIRNKIMQYDGIMGAHDLMVHDYGAGRQFASVHVEMSADGDAIANHEVIDNIERDFLKNDGLRMIVHLDPVPSPNSELGDLRVWISLGAARLDRRITIHDLRMKDGSVSLDCVVPPDMEIGDKEIRNFITNIVKEKYPDTECEINIDRGFGEIAN